MGRPKKINYYRAKESFVTMFKGEQLSVGAGEYVPAGHPLLKRREDHFEPVENFGRFDLEEEEKPEKKPEKPVEQATSAPGEKRNR
jgi:hypothetical protein